MEDDPPSFLSRGRLRGSGRFAIRDLACRDWPAEGSGRYGVRPDSRRHHPRSAGGAEAPAGAPRTGIGGLRPTGQQQTAHAAQREHQTKLRPESRFQTTPPAGCGRGRGSCRSPSHRHRRAPPGGPATRPRGARRRSKPFARNPDSRRHTNSGRHPYFVGAKLSSTVAERPATPR